MSTISRPNHLLIAPAGSGKTVISTIIIHELLKINKRRILVLVPARQLIDEYRRELGNIVDNTKVIVLERKVIREIEALGQKESFWNNTLAISTFQQALSEEVGTKILSIPWDLIVIDDLEAIIYGGKQANFLNLIIEKQIAKRLLILSDPAQKNYSFENSKSILDNQLLVEFEITKWTRKDIYPLGKNTREVSFSVINYERTKEEISFIKKYTSLSKWLSNQKFQNNFRSRLVSSSLYTAEESLRNLRNRLVHGDLNNLLAADETGNEFIKNEELFGDFNADNIDAKSSKIDLANLLKECERVLERLDQTQIDSKLDALLTFFINNQVNEKRTWIYTPYLSTISYLFGSISEIATNVYQMSSQVEQNKNLESINHFKSSGGTLIASTHFLKGLSIPTNNLILYDIPQGENLIYLILSRVLYNMVPDNLHNPVNIVLLNDTSNILSSEKQRLQSFQKFAEQIIRDEL